jgi:NAD(P)H-dependent FMN reductase
MDLTNSPVLLVTHSGGTFATLNVSNLLKGFTTNLYCVTSEWDTQVRQ